MRLKSHYKKIAVPIFAISFSFNVLFLFVHIHYPESIHAAIKDVKNSLRKRKHYLCPVFRGGLGNIMFQYASVCGIAKAKGMDVAVDSLNSLYSVFNISDNTIFDRQICAKATEVYEYHPCGFDIQTMEFDSTKDTKHSSYLQSWKYFDNVENEIRQQFKFRKVITLRAERLIQKAVKAKFKTKNFDRNLTLVGVHVRRGDILEPDKMNYGYNVADSEFIDNAMNYYRKKYNNTLFLVFTNPNKYDRDWCNSNINSDDVIIMHSNAREIDMCMISKCNHTIMTVGSFGWWASWLNQGETVYFKHAARENTSLRADFNDDMQDYYYPGWIGL